MPLAQLRAQMQMGCACLRAVYGLLRVCARSVIRPYCRCRVDFASMHVCWVLQVQQNSGPFWSQTMMLDNVTCFGYAKCMGALGG